MEAFSRPRLYPAAIFIVLLLLLPAFCIGSKHRLTRSSLLAFRSIHWNGNRSTRSSIRRLLPQGGSAAEPAVAEQQASRISEACNVWDIAVYQSPSAPLPSGIPTYTVHIMNESGFAIWHIHLYCGWFSSARMINPSLFRRVRYNDCVVNSGQPLPPGGMLSFQYANTFPYDLSVSYVSCA